MTDKSIVLQSAEHTRQFGAAIAQSIDRGAIITVSGPLGAGKTTLAQGVARGLGVAEAVTSPTFTMMNEYDSGRLPLFHLDLYRLHETPGADQLPREFQMLAAELEEILQAPAVVLIEWPEYFADFFEELDRLQITLQYADQNDDNGDELAPEAARRAVLSGRGANAVRIVESLTPITN